MSADDSYRITEGLSKRELFAAMAMQGALGSRSMDRAPVQDLVEFAVDLAEHLGELACPGRHQPA